MSERQTHNPERIDQLMVDAVTQGLAPQDQAQLDAALRAEPALQSELDMYEMAATAGEMALADIHATEDLPPALRDKLIASAGQHLPAPASLAFDAKARGGAPAQAGPQKFSWTDGRAFGWYAATAAMIALCMVLIQPPKEKIVTQVVEKPVPAKPEGKTPQPEPITQQYAELAKQDKTVTAKWGFNSDAGDKRFANATGEVIWNAETQTGYMKLVGLPVNDPTQEQYQLWIVDGSRSGEKNAIIDGGVFDITEQGEVIVPIDAKIAARNAAVFAITVEAPGGVVESKGPLQVTAAVDAG